MDYGGYVLIGLLIVAGTFFSLALINRGEPKTLKFTTYGFTTLAIAGLVVGYFENSVALKVFAYVFLAVSALSYWFYKGAMKDG